MGERGVQEEVVSPMICLALTVEGEILDTCLDHLKGGKKQGLSA